LKFFGGDYVIQVRQWEKKFPFYEFKEIPQKKSTESKVQKRNNTSVNHIQRLLSENDFSALAASPFPGIGYVGSGKVLIHLVMRCMDTRPELKFISHPLIHTSLLESSAQNVEKKKAEAKTPHFISLNQDIVARSLEAECGLKYVI